jgi:uncharacterized membrane protein YccC
MMLSRFFEIVEYFLNKPTPGLILLIAVLSFCTWLLHGVAEKFKSTAILALCFVFAATLAIHNSDGTILILGINWCVTMALGFELYRRLVDPVERY